ncbi:hypothetical protein FRB99_008425, partial [Tulasnella sp. 403]
MRSRPIKSHRNKYFASVKRPTDRFQHLIKNLVDEHDKKMLKNMDTNLDILLTFAGLFSAVNGGFIALSLALFNPTPSDTTNALLRMLVTHADNTTLKHEQLFPTTSPPAGATRVNCLFSASLVLSLLGALGCIIGKQWFIHYSQFSDVDLSQERGKRRSVGDGHHISVRYQKLMGLRKWRLRTLLEAWLPMLLQLSVFIFLAGLIDFLHLTKPTVAWVTLTIVALGAVAYVYTLQAAVRDRDCPFQTPVSTISLPWIRDSEWRWSDLTGVFEWIIHNGGKLLKWVVLCLMKFFRWIINHLTKLFGLLCGSCGSFSNNKRWQHDGSRPQEDSDDPNAVSPVDIQVTAWMLTTATQPEVLRAAADSLALIHAPGELTSVYVDQGAISQLLALLRYSAKLPTEHELYQSVNEIPDAIIYSRAALHLFLSSFIQYRQTLFGRNAISQWWGTYLETLSFAISRRPTGLLRMHERLVRLIKDGNQGRNIFNEPLEDAQSIPLYMAGLTTAWLSCTLIHKRRDLFQTGDFWKSIRGCLQKTLGQPREANDVITIPWNAINLAAWALCEVFEAADEPDFLPADHEQSSLCRAWNAYTSDENIGKHIVEALKSYQKRTDVNEEYRRDVQEVYPIILNALPNLANEAGGHLTAEIREAMNHRISIALDILHTFSTVDGSAPTSSNAVGIQGHGDSGDDEAGRLSVLEAALTLFIDETVRVNFTHDDYHPFWKAIVVDPPNLQVHRILLDFLKNCLKSEGVDTMEARTVFKACPRLKEAVIRSASNADRGVQIAALRTLPWMVRYAFSKSEEQEIVACLVKSGTRTDAAFKFPEAQEAIYEAAKKLISRNSTRKLTSLEEILTTFCDQAVHSPPETTAVETMLTVWKACRLEPRVSDQQPDWLAEPILDSVIKHVEWRMGQPVGWDTIAENLGDFWNMALAKSPSSTFAARLRELLSPTIATTPDEPEDRRASALTRTSSLLPPDSGPSVTRRVRVHLSCLMAIRLTVGVGVRDINQD